ncbi:MAG: 16S rRNA (uracil(1498)-N(3))-methyltransferase [Holophagales bacterium]|jgi:RsmE family RNA methyltransferase|nr:16S rRNA (uracil(1498)-N(3))-methyltransferase [Holophagales bacterium]
MNLIILHPDDFIAEGRVRLEGRRLEHVFSIHRAKVGDSLKVGLLGANMGIGRIAMLDGQVLEMDVELDQPPQSKLPLNLVVALPRPKALNRVLAAATSLGVQRIVLMNAWRVEKSYWKSPRLSEENLFRQRVLGLEQGVDTVLPELQLARFFADFVLNDLPKMAQGTLCLVAHPQAAEACPADVNRPCTLVLGPEGGFIPDELAALERIGFMPVRLGGRVLRTETALAALVGRLYG